MLLEELIKCCDGKSNPIKFFSAHQIHEAADKSSQIYELYSVRYDWKLGKDENHPMILIKKPRHMFVDYKQKNFCRDVAVSSMVSGHKNFLKLVGCCLEFEVPVIVYNGVKKHYQLRHIINRQPWEKRMKMAEDIATALAYLHTAFPRPFVCRSLIPDNVLLDEDGVAKLSDFSECVSIPEGETFVKFDNSYYSNIFMDINYLRDGLVSVETDVYALGMLMNCLLHGFPELDTDMLEIIGKISGKELCQMNAFQKLSQRCIGEVEVPTMVEVAKELKKIQKSLITTFLLL